MAAGSRWRTPLFPGDEAILDASEITRRLKAEPTALRLDTTAALARLGSAPKWREAGPDRETEIVGNPLQWGDVVLARKETPTSYHLSVVVNDALQEISDVVRGRDLLQATSIHRLLQDLLGLPAPKYRHHRLILDEDGHKLAKSAASTGFSELRAVGATPDDIRRKVGLDSAEGQTASR